MTTATRPPWATGLVFGSRGFKPGGERYHPHDDVGVDVDDTPRIEPLDYRHRPRLTIFTYGGHDNQPILRFSSWSEASGGEAARGGPQLVAVGRGSPPTPVRWETVPLDRDPWHVEVPVPITPPRYQHPTNVDYGGGRLGEGGSGALLAWGGAVRGWAAGATLLALLVLLARAAEKCLDWKFLRRRRRMQAEWQRANVRATCRDGENSLPELSEISVDLPPPYSECGPKTEEEEAPPPYSDSVHILDKDGVPVLVYSRLVDRLQQAAAASASRGLRTDTNPNDGLPTVSTANDQTALDEIPGFADASTTATEQTAADTALANQPDVSATASDESQINVNLTRNTADDVAPIQCGGASKDGSVIV